MTLVVENIFKQSYGKISFYSMNKDYMIEKIKRAIQLKVAPVEEVTLIGHQSTLLK